MFGNNVCEVLICYHRDYHLTHVLFTNHVSRNEQRYIFQKMIETSHTVLPNTQYTMTATQNFIYEFWSWGHIIWIGCIYIYIYTTCFMEQGSGYTCHTWSHLSHLVMSGHIWSCLVISGYICHTWSHLIMSSQVLSSHLATYGNVWSYLPQVVTSGLVLSLLVTSSHLRLHLVALSHTCHIWSCLVTSGHIWSHLVISNMVIHPKGRLLW